jgi:DNA-binding response OmpR family regulator
LSIHFGPTPTELPRRILVVDDSDDDVQLLRLAVEQAKVPWTITAVLRDGEQAIDHLEDFANPWCAVLTPQMLLLDLKMPRSDGFEVLRWIGRNMPEGMKTIVLSASPEPADMQRARELGADRYIVKPTTFEELLVVVRKLEGAMSQHSAMSNARIFA